MISRLHQGACAKTLMTFLFINVFKLWFEEDPCLYTFMYIYTTEYLYEEYLLMNKTAEYRKQKSEHRIEYKLKIDDHKDA